MTDRVRLSTGAKNQLSALKRRTGIEHNNVLCRHALCLSLENVSTPPAENHDLSDGIEIDWRVLTGGHEALYYNLVATRLILEGVEVSEASIKDAIIHHIHRGLGYLMSKNEDDLLIHLARGLTHAH